MLIDEIRSYCSDEDIVMTQHVIDRCRERGIKYDDILHALKTGEIIEDYPSDYPHPSCLLMGPGLRNAMLHIVVGLGNDKLWVITAYYPTDNRWNEGFRTRKGELK